MNLNDFKDYWELEKGQKSFSKFVDERLTVKELMKVRDVITTMQKRNLPSGKIIEALQRINGKLIEKWKAERAYYTEVKRMDTGDVAEAGENLDVKKYRVVLSPNACDVCRKKSDNGRKTFSDSDVQKSGYGEFIPWHPNCYCVVLPID